jgi:NAD(P)-dependent dehydrogenase (short-subunit alcohol dehydrogenase family)
MTPARTVTFDFTDARVVVTGGTSGIGRATAEAFRAAGARVLVTGTKPQLADYLIPARHFDYHALQLERPESIEASPRRSRRWTCSSTTRDTRCRRRASPQRCRST